MINLVYGVIRISNKCSWLKIFDQQGNLNFTFPWSDSLSLGLSVLVENKTRSNTNLLKQHSLICEVISHSLTIERSETAMLKYYSRTCEGDVEKEETTRQKILKKPFFYYTLLKADNFSSSFARSYHDNKLIYTLSKS